MTLATAQVGVDAAMFLLSMQRPYLASALWAMQRVQLPGLGTFAVDRRWRLYYDPEAAAAWSVDEVAGVLYHEVCHLLRAHADRRVALGADPLVWNLAADAEINDDLEEEAGVVLPAGAVMPASFGQPAGLLAEEYYQFLLRRAGSSSVDGACTSKVRVTAGQCGAGAGGVEVVPAEFTATVSGLAEQEGAVVRRAVAVAVRAYSRSRGSLPGHWERWAESLLEPQVDWRRRLAASVRAALGAAAGALDYTYARPSRRQSCFGRVIAPALRRPTPAVVVVVDTSGSMTDLLGLALAELGGILRAAGLREGVRVLCVDTAVQASQRIWRPEQVALMGGGGTDLRVGLDAAQHQRPDVVVVLTDGFTPWPEQAPKQGRVVIVDLVGSQQFPEWAEVIRVD